MGLLRKTRFHQKILPRLMLVVVKVKVKVILKVILRLRVTNWVTVKD